MRLDIFRKLDALAPAYLMRRRTGDLVALATHDIELIEYFFAHTITPAFVAVLVPAAVLVVAGAGPSAGRAWCCCRSSSPPRSAPFLCAARIDRLGSRAREMSGDLGAFAVDSVQGLGEIVAFQRGGRARRGVSPPARDAYLRCACPSSATSRCSSALQEIATGLGGLAVVVAGAGSRRAGRARPRRCCRCSPCSPCRPSCRCGRSPRSAASSPTRWGAARRVYAPRQRAGAGDRRPGVRRSRGPLRSR